MSRKLFPIAAVLSLFSFCQAAEEVPTIRVELRMLAFAPSLQQKDAFAHDPAAEVGAASVAAPIKTYLNHEFSTLQLKSRKVVFTTKPDRESLTREADRIGEVTLPEGVSSAILLFLPANAGGKGTCQIMTINDAVKAFPAGSYHATNLSPLPVRLMLEQKAFEFKSGQTMLIENPPVRAGNQSGMRTFAFKNNAWAQIATSLWPHPGKGRGVLVFFANPATGEIQLKAFDDVPPRAPAEAGKAAAKPVAR